MSPSNAERDQITRAAKALLAAGQIPGLLTVVRLAEAAGVKRWRLTHKHPDLMRDFHDRAAHINRENLEVLKLRKRLATVDRENQELRARLRDLDDLVARCAQVINELAHESEEARSQARSCGRNQGVDTWPIPIASHLAAVTATATQALRSWHCADLPRVSG